MEANPCLTLMGHLTRHHVGGHQQPAQLVLRAGAITMASARSLGRGM